MEQKLRDLRERFEAGEQQLMMLDQKRAELRDSLLRLSGAIEVLEQMVASNGHQEASTLEEAIGVGPQKS
jgi:prefoldin subunit 5